MIERERGTYHSHLLVIGDRALRRPDLSSDHWWYIVTDDDHANHLGAYVLKGARTDLAAHLGMNGGHLGHASPGFWRGPWGDTYDDCDRARRQRARFTRPQKISRTKNTPVTARPAGEARRSAADEAAIQVLRTLQSTFGGKPRRWRADLVATAADALGCAPGSVRETVNRAYARVVTIQAQRSIQQV